MKPGGPVRPASRASCSRPYNRRVRRELVEGVFRARMECVAPRTHNTQARHETDFHSRQVLRPFGVSEKSASHCATSTFKCNNLTRVKSLTTPHIVLIDLH